ncbi:MAG: hypothetical protein RR500_03905 [Bacilli bacterium]
MKKKENINDIVIVFIKTIVIISFLFLIYLTVSFIERIKLNKMLASFAGTYILTNNNYHNYNMDINPKNEININKKKIVNANNNIISTDTFNVIVDKNKPILLVYFGLISENQTNDFQYNIEKICFIKNNNKLIQHECPSKTKMQALETKRENYNIEYKKKS